jgi:hypothetical protein
MVDCEKGVKNIADRYIDVICVTENVDKMWKTYPHRTRNDGMYTVCLKMSEANIWQQQFQGKKGLSTNLWITPLENVQKSIYMARNC